MFVTTGYGAGEWQDNIIKHIGLKKEMFPALIIMQNNEETTSGKKRFKYEGSLGTLTVQDVETFIDDWAADILPPLLKSEKPPKDPLDGNVHVLVGTTHDEFAYQPFDVVVEYYADWCPHCKTLAPIYSQLADDLKDVTGLKIAKMLATENETAVVSATGYPTIVVYGEDLPFGTTPTKYISGRTYEDIMAEL